MAINDVNVQELLAQANPNAPTAQDIEANKASAESAAAQKLADAGTKSSIPVSPAEFKTPEDAGTLTKPPAPGSFGFHLAKAVSDTLTNPKTAAEAAAPGGATKNLFLATTQALGAWNAATSGQDATRPTTPPPAQPSRAQRIIHNVGASFGDLSAATEGGPSGGGIAGAARVARAQSQRESQEAKDRQLMATSNAQMLHSQMLIHKMGEEEREANIAKGEASIKNITEPPQGGIAGTTDFKGQTSDDLNRLLKVNPATGKSTVDPSVQTVFPDGKVQVGKDANGVPRYQTTYSVVTPAPEVDVSVENAKRINAAHVLGTELSTDEKALQRMPGAQLNGLLQKAETAEANKRAAEVKDAKDQKAVDEAQNSKAGKAMQGSPTLARINAAMNAPGTDGSPDPYAIVKSYDYLMTHPDDAKKVMQETGATNLSGAFLDYAGGENFFKGKQEEYAKAQAKAELTRDGMLQKFITTPGEIQSDTEAAIAVAQSIMNDPAKKGTPEQADAARVFAIAKNTQALKLQTENDKEVTKDRAKKNIDDAKNGANNPNGLTGEAYLKTLPAGLANEVRAFGTGTMLISPGIFRSEKSQPLVQAIFTAYPGLDESSAVAYAKTRTNFSTGKEGAGINSANTAIHHANRMYQNLNKATAGWTGSVEQFFGGNEAGRAVSDDALAISGELGKLYTGGVVTEGEKKDWEAKLDPKGLGMTVNKLKTNVKEFIKLLGGKLEAYQDQWDDAVPDPSLKAPKAIASPESIDTYKRLTGEDLKVHATQQTKQAAAQTQTPPPETHTFDSKAWAAANPGKDVNAAIAQAKKKGYEVK